jgi:hypothetical protein
MDVQSQQLAVVVVSWRGHGYHADDAAVDQGAIAPGDRVFVRVQDGGELAERDPSIHSQGVQDLTVEPVHGHASLSIIA